MAFCWGLLPPDPKGIYSELGLAVDPINPGILEYLDSSEKGIIADMDLAGDPHMPWYPREFSRKKISPPKVFVSWEMMGGPSSLGSMDPDLGFPSVF